MQDDRGADEYERAQRRMSREMDEAVASLPQAPAEHVATLVARSPGRVVSMTCSCGVSVVGDVMPFAGVTRLMLEHLNRECGDSALQALLDRGVTPVPRFAPGGVVHAPSVDDLIDTFIQRIAGTNLTLQQADRIITQARVRCRKPIPADTPDHLVRRVFPDTGHSVSPLGFPDR